ADLRGAQAGVVPRDEAREPIAVEVLLPVHGRGGLLDGGDPGLVHRGEGWDVVLRESLEGRVPVDVAVLEPVAEVPVQVAADAAGLARRLVRTAALRAEDVRRHPEREILVGREEQVDVGTRDVEGVVVVVSGSGWVELGEELRAEPGLAVESPVRVEERANLELVEPLLRVVVPGRLHLRDLGLQLVLLRAIRFLRARHLGADLVLDLPVDRPRRRRWSDLPGGARRGGAGLSLVELAL